MPLQEAYTVGNEDIVKLLIEYGARGSPPRDMMLILPDLHYPSSLSEPDPIALPNLEISQYFLGYRPYYILVNSSPLRSGLIKDSCLPNQYRCRSCGRTFTTPIRRLRHERSEHSPNTICTLCGNTVRDRISSKRSHARACRTLPRTRVLAHDAYSY